MDLAIGIKLYVAPDAWIGLVAIGGLVLLTGLFLWLRMRPLP